MKANKSDNRVVYDMTSELYHANSAVSRSGLMLFNKSPQHYWWQYLSGKAEKTESDAMRIGSAFHTLLLEPAKFDSRVLVWSGKPRNTTAGKEDFAQATAEANGRLLIKQDELAELKHMAESILSQPVASKVIGKDGYIEPSFFWVDEQLKVFVKSRPDYYREDGIVLDLKTTADASREEFERSVVKFGYDIQAYMQMEAIERCTGKRPDNFVFICVEKEPPYATAFYVADQNMLDCGAFRYRKLLEKYAECLHLNTWPGYGSLIQPISAPEWFIKRIQNQEEKEFLNE